MILVITGLAREARIVAGPDVVALYGARDLAGRIEAAIAAHPFAGVMSFGVCGALEPGLKPGDLVAGTAVVEDGEVYPCDSDWRARLIETLNLDPDPCNVSSSPVMVTEADAKAALRQRDRAAIVDMESGAAARAARAHGLPLAVLRAVSDAAERDLPRAVLSGMTPEGGMNVWGVVGALARDPRQLPDLLRTAGEAERGFRALDHARRLLGPRIGRLDLGQLLLDVG
jgi:hopanoid-associated phosphorylase